MLEKNSSNQNQNWELSERELNQISDFEARIEQQ